MAVDWEARIDAHRAHMAATMLVSGQAPGYEEPTEVLVNLGELDGRAILAKYDAKNLIFATAPFDPDGEVIRFYPGGVTVWSGFPGAGKTTILRQFVCHTLSRGSSIFMASLEEDPSDVLVRLAATAAGQERPNEHQMQWFIDEYSKRFRLWGVIGVARHLRILATVRQLADQGIKHFVIDSLMCMDVRNDDFEGQRQFANLIAATARAANIHIHLVAHPRKLLNADQQLDLNDVAGAREIGGVADNVLFIRRRNESQSYGPNADVTPMCVSVRKQRHYRGYVGDIPGYFYRKMLQFRRDQFCEQPIRYLPDDAYAVR